MFKPFIFSKNGRYYARFYIPKKYRDLINKRYLFYTLLTSNESIARYNDSHLQQKVKEKIVNFANFTNVKKNEAENVVFNKDFFDDERQPLNMDFFHAQIEQLSEKMFQVAEDKLQRLFEMFVPAIQAKEASLAAKESAIQQFFTAMQSTMPVLTTMQSTIPASPPLQQKTPLQTAFDKFLMMKDKQSKITKNIYQNNINNYLEFFFSQKKGTEICYINDITHQDMVDFREFLIKKLNNCSRTVDNKTDFFKALFKFAISENIMNHNPTEKIKSLLTRKEHKEDMHGIFDMNQLKYLYSNDNFIKSQVKDYDFFTGILLLTTTACRSGEIQNIRYNQFKFTTDGKIPFLDIYSSKTKSRREVPIPQIVFEYLNRHYQILENMDSDKQLFKYNENGNAMGKKFRYIQEKTDILVDKNGKELVPHSIRKFVNDHIRKNGVSQEIREQLLGHSENASINRSIYSTQFSVQEIHDAVNKHIEYILTETGLMSKITS